ncbi:hypothetical protein UC34_12205 [Pandoraea vervacti]|uniref:Autotransporter domain-containing protein n=1 Tax=Pandoraea vervacti TaxID=656178 RepID=A0ABM6FR29_9BURK|nr:autotransporter outer membrane beta-barrel domain-containing protein [Pandoraea vervacti]APD11264.1 hypothetical protein UC34_12205 [Pandoraea vervacti]
MNKRSVQHSRSFKRTILYAALFGDALSFGLVDSALAQQLKVTNTTTTKSDQTYNSVSSGRTGSAIYVTGTGQLTGNNLTATTNTSSASALAAETGGWATLTGGSLRSPYPGTTSYTVLARNSGSSITLNNVEVTSGTSSAVVATDSAQIRLVGGSVTLNRASGTEPAMALMTQFNGTITAQDVAITVTGDLLRGASSLNSLVSLTGGTVNVTGKNSYGLYADRLGTLGQQSDALTASGVKITTSGTGANAVQVITGASATLTDMNVTTTGDDAIGVHAGLGASVNVNGNTSITTTGARAFGADAGGLLNGTASTLTLNVANGSIATSGAQAHGLLAREGGSVTMNGGSVTASGTDAAAIAARASTINVNGATLTSRAGVGALVVGSSAVGLVNTNLSAAGHGVSVLAQSGLITAMAIEQPDSAAQPVTPGTPVAPASNAVTVRGGSITAGGDLVHVEGASADITLSGGVQATSASGLLLNALSSGGNGSRVNLVMDGVTLNGSIAADASSLVNASLQNSSVLTGKIDPVSLAIDGTSRWNLTADSQLRDLTMTSGALIRFQPPTAGVFKSLTVQGALTGTGTIGLNTVLAGDGAPSDTVVINGGTATGTTALRIANAGGAGAFTTANGIQVVNAVNGGTTASTAFALDGRAVAGPYEYQLFRGSTDGSNANAWYLRSEQPQPQPTPDPDPGPPTPLYRPEVAAYLANQRLAAQMFVHSLHDRLGESQYVEGQGFSPGADKPRSGWLRVVGKWEGSRSADGTYKTSTNSVLLNGGAELAKWQVFGQADRAHLGVMGSYGNANSDANARGNAFNAKGKVDGWSVGAYGTWYQNDERKLGAYTDVWFQYGWFTNRVEGDALPTVRYTAMGWAISGEAGYAVPVHNDWVVEPQTQFIYVGYNENDFAEPNGTKVTGANARGWISRLGARFYRTFVRDDARKWQPYVTFNWWHSNTSNTVSFNDVPQGSMYPSNWYEVKLGVNADFRKGLTGWANVSGAWGAQSFYQYALRVGVKYTW